MVTLKPYEQLIISEAVERDLSKYYHRGVHEGKEYCGIIAGQLGVASSVIEIPNISEGATYTFDPIAFNSELNKLDTENKELLALFHTHPPNALALSQFDIDNAKLNVAHVVVSSVMEPDDELPKVDYKGWLIKDKKPEEVRFVVPSRQKLGDDKKTSGIEIKITADGLNAFANMIDSYFGSMRMRTENRRLQERTDEHDYFVRNMMDRTISRPRLRRNPRGGRHLPPTSDDCSLYGSDDDLFASPDDIAEEELEIERIEGNPMRFGEHGRIYGADKGPKAPAHKHLYEWVSETPDGMNVYECNFPDCNKKITVNGDIMAGKPTPLDPPVPFVPAKMLITPIGEKTVVCLECGGEAMDGHNFCKDCITAHGLLDTRVEKEDTSLSTQAQVPPAYCWGCGVKIGPDARILNGFCVKCIKGEPDKELIRYCYNCGDKLPEINAKCEKCDKTMTKDKEKKVQAEIQESREKQDDIRREIERRVYKTR